MSLAASLDEIQLKIEILESSLAAFSSSSLVEEQNWNTQKTSVSSVPPSTPSSTSLINKVASFLEDADEEGYRKVSHSFQHSTTESDRLFLEETFQNELEALIFLSPTHLRKVQREPSSLSSTSPGSNYLTGCTGKDTLERTKMTSSERKDDAIDKKSVEEWGAEFQRGTAEDGDITHAKGIERAASIVLQKLREKSSQW